MNNLKQIEQQYNFQYPALYQQLYTEGMLDWGTASPTWITEQYPLLRKNPPLLLFANDFELSSIKDVDLQLREFANPNYWMNIKPGLQFVPFAKNGAGDMYCFLPTARQGDDIPVVFLWHDANRAEYKAKNLQDFIFRAMLEAVADCEEADYGLLGEENFIADLNNFLRTHAKYLSQKQKEVVTQAYQLPGNNKPLINNEQLKEILEKEISWEHLDTEFKYQNDKKLI